jgi:uncharacterized protein (UPF0276 family)
VHACATATTSEPIPARAGIGLRSPHYQELLDSRPDVAWLEVHSENYFGGGAPLYFLERAREHYPLSLHGVGMSLGSADPLHRPHLERLKQLIARVEPGFVSDHLSWASIDGRYLNDLLPLPYTEEALDHVVGKIAAVQDYLGRRLLIENPSTYLQYSHSTLTEWDFLVAAAQRAGCGILLDVNNIYVSARNHGFDPLQYLRGVPPALVQELHLAGHLVRQVDGREILIDTHNARVCEAVWALYRTTLSYLGARPTLIEWDADIPLLDVLVEEADIAARHLEQQRATIAA